MNQVEVKRRQIQGWAYILGFISLLLFGRMLGDNGAAYMAAAYECFAFLWTVLGGGVADALGRMLRVKNVKGQYKSAARVRKYIMLSGCAMGLMGSLVLAFGGRLVIVNVFHMPHGAFLAVALAPAFFLRMAGEVLLGYFQGEGSELPAAVSSVLRQVFLLGFGLLFGGLLKNYGKQVSRLLGVQDFTAMWGAIGVAIGMSLAELLLLLFLLVVHKGSSPKARYSRAEGMRTADSFGGALRGVHGGRMGVQLVRLLVRLPLLLGIVFLQRWSEDAYMAALAQGAPGVNGAVSAQGASDAYGAVSAQGVPDAYAALTAQGVPGVYASISAYGRYYGKYLALGAILVLFTDVLLLPIIAKTASFLRRDEGKPARNSFQGGLHLGVVQGLYFSVFVAAMSSQLAGTLGEQGEGTAAMLGCGSFAILFVILAGYFSRLLLLAGGQRLVLACAGGMNIIYVISIVIFLNTGHFIQSLVYAGLIAAGALCAALAVLACLQLGMGIDWLQTFGIPMGCACVTGLLCMFLGRLLTPGLGNTVTVIVCLALSAPAYWVFLLLLRNFREQELKLLPFGRLVRALGQLLQVYR